MYAHLFENPRVGLARGLFWDIRVDFEPVELFGEEWEPSLGVGWLTWPARKLGDLDGADLGALANPEKVEATLYLVAEHHWIELDCLSLRRVAPDRFLLQAAGRYDIESDEKLAGDFSFDCELAFTGVLVVPSNLEPAPSNSEEVADAVAEWISLDDFEAPEFDRFRYALRARVG